MTLALDHARNRMAAAHRLAHCDDVGLQAYALMAPEPFTIARETGLHLIGNSQAPGLAHDPSV